MTRFLPLFLTALLLAAAAVTPTLAQPAVQCGLSQAAFCDTFDQPAGTGNRAGQLDGLVWGVSRVSGMVDFGQGQYDTWGPTHLQGCDGSNNVVNADNDVIVCNGQLREASNDNHTVTTLAMYPKQPFDFAGRIGTVVFDVTNDTQGTHGMWPEFWMSDQPVPAPFTHGGDLLSLPKNGFGIRFAANAEVGSAGICPNGNNIDQRRWTIDTAIVVRNFVMEDTSQPTGRTGMTVTPTDCVVASTGPDGAMNHIRLAVSQNEIDVFASDAGASALREIGTITNANLTLSRGLTWIEDSHYNAEKSPCLGGVCPDEHTFTWDNFGFDGPVLARDLAFDASDAVSGTTSAQNIGWLESAGQVKQITIPGVTGLANSAPTALLTVNLFPQTPPANFAYTVNGHAHTEAWPYPDTDWGWHSLALPVPISDLVAGSNVVTITSTNSGLVFANIDLVLPGAGGVPGPSGTATPTSTAAATSTPAPTNTPTPVPTGMPTSTPVAVITPTPATCTTVNVEVSVGNQHQMLTFCQ